MTDTPLLTAVALLFGLICALPTVYILRALERKYR